MIQVALYIISTYLCILAGIFILGILIAMVSWMSRIATPTKQVNPINSNGLDALKRHYGLEPR